ncbi:MAG: hypothetical protein A2Z52_00455 [Candidatus Moranbacteria bacterium RBG_19FT_COMBO_42_6]|nr:MAG: hypothetical protein A2Z52_00455 [Candidatus Moranbacteria bacterium RBG_19FT_COMBO_42_6]
MSFWDTPIPNIHLFGFGVENGIAYFATDVAVLWAIAAGLVLYFLIIRPANKRDDAFCAPPSRMGGKDKKVR